MDGPLLQGKRIWFILYENGYWKEEEKWQKNISKHFLDAQYGEINGKISIEADENYTYENINAFYTLSHNIFHLIIKEVGEQINE